MTKRNVVCEVHVSQPLRAPLNSKTGIVHRFSHDKVDGDEEEKRGENVTLPLTPVLMSNISVFPTLVFTQQLELRQSVLNMLMNLSGTP